MAPDAILSPTAETAAGAADDIGAASLHVARRLTFGPTPSLLSEVQEAGVDSWLSVQLDPRSIDDTETDRRLWALSGLGFDVGRLLPGAMPVLDGLGLTPGVDAVSQQLAGATAPLDMIEAALSLDERQRIERVVAELRLATVVRATYSRRQLFELAVDHWWNHFNIWPGKSLLVAGMMPAADRNAIRPHALGGFADLLAAVAASPAMLAYLDNWTNRAGAPNENYGRELLELHTVGVESGFTERDVRDAARVFTGWTIDLSTGRFRFEPRWHDSGPKQVLDWSTPGLDGPSGVDEGRALLDHLAHHPATANRVATRLVRRLVADTPPSALVSSTAGVYLANDTQTAPVVRHIVGSDDFRASATSKVRRPLDFFIAALRSVGADIGDPIGPNTRAGRTIDRTLRHLGQRPFDASSPAGYPEEADSWLGAGLLPRWIVSHELARGQLGGIAVDLEPLRGEATSAGELVDHVLTRLHGATHPDRRSALLDGLAVAPTDDVDRVDLEELVGLALCAAEAHQR